MQYKLKPKQYIDITDWDYDKRQRFFPSMYNHLKYRVVFAMADGQLNGCSEDYDHRYRWLKDLKRDGYKPFTGVNNLGRM